MAKMAGMPCMKVTLVLSRSPARRILTGEKKNKRVSAVGGESKGISVHPSPAPVLENVGNLLRGTGALDGRVGLRENGVAALKGLDHLPGLWRVVSGVVGGHAWVGGARGEAVGT